MGRRGWRRTALALGSLALALLLADWLFPPPLPTDAAYTRVVSDSQGNPLRTFAAADGILRYRIGLEEVSPHYLEALLGYEDRWFHYHPGINPLALLRAAGQYLRHGRVLSGGSTLSMQLARLLEPQPRNLAGKLRQMARALQLEWRLDKGRILELYLNHAPFGGNLEGVEAASRAYLGKPALRLSHGEAALLAVLPQSPSRLRPDRWPERARQARDKLLQRLEGFAVWSAQVVREARQERVYAARPRLPMEAPLLAWRLAQRQPEALRLPTTIDGDLQRGLYELVLDHLQQFPEPVTAAVLVLRNDDGAILGYLGTADFANPRRFGYVDMIQALRSPGSTLKPFLYGLAIDEGLIHSQSLLADVPRRTGDYRPANFQDGFSGPVTASEALQRSLNLPAVQLLEHYGPGRFAARLGNAGLDLAIPGDGRPTLSVILGGAGVRLEQLVGLYRALARRGLAIAPRSQPDEPVREHYLMSPGAAWISYRTLADNPGGEFAPSRYFQSRGSLAWKTGTSYGYRDAWAIGVNPDHSIGVWVGRPDGTPAPGQFGALSAAPLLFRIAAQLPAAEPAPRQPDSVSQAVICHPLGLLETLTPPGACHRRHKAWLLDGAAPPTLPDEPLALNPVTLRVDPGSGRLLPGDCPAERSETRRVALWPKQLEPWLPGELRRSALLPPAAAHCDASAGTADALLIHAISDGAHLRRAGPKAPPPSIELAAVGGRGQRHWYLNGRYYLSTAANESHHIPLTQPGPLQVAVIDEAGNLDQKRVYLEAGP